MSPRVGPVRLAVALSLIFVTAILPEAPLVAAAAESRAKRARAPTGETAATACPRTQAVPVSRTVLALDPRLRAPRVFAMQFRQLVANVRTYGTFRVAIECTLRRFVLPYLARGRPNVVVFDEDVGLMTIAAGSRGARARGEITSTSAVPACGASPCATLAALRTLDSGYARQEAFYTRRFGKLPQLGASFVAATDVFARGFMQTFSDVARRHGIYLIASNTQAPFHLSRRRADVRALADPDLSRPRSVYVANGRQVYDQTFIWAPHDVRRTGPALARNLVDTNRKVPLTGFETALGFAPGPRSGPAAVANLRPYRLPGTRARLGLATSLPAFAYGAPAPGHACDDVSVSYMPCLSSLGANVVIQADANDGSWTGPDADPTERWQPLAWMSSAYRAVSDPAVGFLYAVNPLPGRQPRRHSVRRSERHPAAWTGRPRLQLHRRPSVRGRRGPPRPDDLRRPEVPVPRARPLGRFRPPASCAAPRRPELDARPGQPARERICRDGAGRRPAAAP